MPVLVSFMVAVCLAAVAPGPLVDAPPATAVVQQQNQGQSESEPKPIDINAATEAQLQEVPGIGEALAKRIVEFRTEHGPFEKVDDLLNVRGIGIASLEKLKPFLTVKQGG